MPTPSIQTLRADAQQVLNLDSISAVRSVVAATLANANAGTPLNPNLTTQQLWNEFYQIVTQPKSDIESIIANQLMKFLYAPPAPGGVGADGQVIFNDGGVLAGDPQFLWNKTTNLLTVTGSATITGDLTVDTNVLKVDSTNNRVGVGTASPALPFVVSNAGAQGFEINPNGSIVSGGIDILSYNRSTSVYKGVGFAAESYLFRVGTVSATDAMTLNSTGLGVGGSPATKIFANVTPPGAGQDGMRVSDGTRLIQMSISGSTYAYQGIGSNQNVIYASGNPLSILSDAQNLRLGTSSTSYLLLDTSGNVGIGVTPSAWATLRGLQNGRANIVGYVSNAEGAWLTNNAFYDGSWKYQTSAQASHYQQLSGVHSWSIAGTGTAGSAITFTQAMTLDASGRLGVGAVPASNVRAHFKGSSNSTDFSIYCVNSSDKLTFSVRNDGLFITGSLTDVATLPSSPYNLTTGSAANVHVDSQGIFYRSTSSIKYKTDVTDSVRGLADVLKLRPVTYKAKNSGNTVFGGLIAEEVAAAGLTEFVEYSPDNTPDAIHYGNMVSLLVAAIKELSAEVNALKKA